MDAALVEGCYLFRDATRSNLPDYKICQMNIAATRIPVVSLARLLCSRLLPAKGEAWHHHYSLYHSCTGAVQALILCHTLLVNVGKSGGGCVCADGACAAGEQQPEAEGARADLSQPAHAHPHAAAQLHPGQDPGAHG